MSSPCLVRGMLIEHGWVERDGEILDPTLPREEIVYFSGLRFEGEKGIAEAMRRPKLIGKDDLPFFYRYGWGGHDSPEFCEARRRGQAYANSLVVAPESALNQLQSG